MQNNFHVRTRSVLFTWKQTVLFFLFVCWAFHWLFLLNYHLNLELGFRMWSWWSVFSGLCRFMSSIFRLFTFSCSYWTICFNLLTCFDSLLGNRIVHPDMESFFCHSNEKQTNNSLSHFNRTLASNNNSK